MYIEPEYTIEDTEETVSIEVVFKGRTAAKCDLVVTDLYAKFNLNPFLLYVDFPKKVSFKNVIASAKGSNLSVKIRKEVSERWTEIPFKADDIETRREESLQRLIESAQREREELDAARARAETEAMRRAWEVEKQQREELQTAIDKEKEFARNDLAGDNSAQDLASKPLYEEEYVAPVRGQLSTVSVEHTPTMKDVAARYKGPARDFVVAKKGGESPYWMKKQGDTFFNRGDYKSAAAAYTEAINSSDRQFVAALSNRAAVRLKMKQYQLALNDCDEALAMIAEPILTMEHGMSKSRLLARKMCALFHMKRYIEAFKTATEIQKFIKDDPTLDEDVKTISTLAKQQVKTV